jgi:hypothetical protein
MLTIADKLSFEDHVRMAEIEKNYWNEELISKPEITFEWSKHNPDTIVAVRDTKTNLLAGHLSIIPIDDKIYNKIKSGNYVDTEIPIEHIKKYDSPGEYKLYCCATAIAPEYKGGPTFKMMIKEYIRKFNSFEKNGIYLTDVISDNLTSIGEKFSKISGMNLINTSNHNSKIMWTDGLMFKKKLINYFGDKH